MGERGRRIARPKGRNAVLLVVGVFALLSSGLLGYVTIRDTFAPEPAASVETDRYVSREGGFSIEAPTDMDVEPAGRTIQLTSKDRSLVVNVGPGSEGSLQEAQAEFLTTLKERYRSFEPLAAEAMEVDGRSAISVSGTATNANRVRIRFVVMVVEAQPRNYTIAAYAAHDSDPGTVLPRVNAVANGFKVLP